MSMQVPKAVRRYLHCRMAVGDGGRFSARIMTPFFGMRTRNDLVSIQVESVGRNTVRPSRGRAHRLFKGVSVIAPIQSPPTAATTYGVTANPHVR